MSGVPKILKVAPVTVGITEASTPFGNCALSPAKSIPREFSIVYVTSTIGLPSQTV